APGQRRHGAAVMERLSRVWQARLMWSFRQSPTAVLSLVVVLLLVAGAVLAPWIAPHDPFDPSTLNLMNGFTPPMQPNRFTGEVFWLGTDDQGRDVFSAILF